MASAILFLLLWNNCSICDSATPECLLCYLSSHYVCSSAHRKGTQFLLLQISNCTCRIWVSLEFFLSTKDFLHFSLACLTELCSVRFERCLLSTQARCQSCLWQLKLIIIICHQWYKGCGSKLVWAVHVWMGKKAAREQKNWSRVKSYKSLYYFILLLSFLLANHM